MRTMMIAGVLLAGATVNAAGQEAMPMPMPMPSPMSGYLEFYGQKATQDYWGDYYNPWLGIGGAARVNWWHKPGWSMQFDVAGQQLVESGDYYYSTGTLYGAAHISKRTDTYLIGLFGGVAMTTDYYGVYGWDTSIFGGVEGQMYWDNFTLYGQVGFARQLSGYYSGEYNFGLPFAQIEGRYFITPNTRVSANVGVVSGNIWGYYGGETWLTYGGEIEHKFSTNPISVFGRLQGYSGSGYYDLSGHRLMVGLKVNWGSDTLFAQDRSGATLKVWEDLAPIGDMRAWD